MARPDRVCSWKSAKQLRAAAKIVWNTGDACSSALYEPQPSKMSWSSHIIRLGIDASASATGVREPIAVGTRHKSARLRHDRPRPGIHRHSLLARQLVEPAQLRNRVPELVGVDLVAAHQQDMQRLARVVATRSRQTAFLSAIRFMSPGTEKPLQEV